MLKILLTGLPGSGKTTIAKKISQEKGLCVVKTGELLRDLSKGDDEVARQLKQVMQSGIYAPDKLVGEMVEKFVESPSCAMGYVMDGYPRRLSQLQIYDPKPTMVFYLHISEGLVKQRLLSRGRVDDTPEIISRRLKVFEEQMQPLLDYYREKGLLIQIDAEKSVDEVFRQIEEHLR